VQPFSADGIQGGELPYCRHGTASAHSADMTASWPEQAPGWTLRAVYELHGRLLTPRPGTITPSADHLSWHAREVFKGTPLAA
jgi:hypothetical protein